MIIMIVWSMLMITHTNLITGFDPENGLIKWSFTLNLLVKLDKII